jgi:hypothetical protein
MWNRSNIGHPGQNSELAFPIFSKVSRFKMIMFKVHDFILDEVAEKVRVPAESDKSIRRLVVSAVNYGRQVMENVVAFRPRV